MILTQRSGLILRAIAIDRHHILILYKDNNSYSQGRVWGVFHIHTKKWFDLPKLPALQYQIGLVPMPVIHQGYLYVIVGYEGTSTMWRMNMNLAKIKKNGGNNCSDPFIFKWEKISENDFELSLFGFSVVSGSDNNTIYVSGGYGYDDANDYRLEVKQLKSVYPILRNDPSPWEWRKYSDMPYKRRDHASVVVKNKIYLLGGYGQVYNSQKRSIADETLFVRTHTVDVFDISTETWGSVPDIPANMSTKELSAVVVKNRWIVSLSRDGDDSCFIYDTKSRVWFQGGVQRSKGINSKSCGIMPGHDHIKIAALDDSNEIIVIGQNHPHQQTYGSGFAIKSIPFIHLHPWFAVGELILLQRLVHTGRANTTLVCRNQNDRTNSDHIFIIQKLIVDLNDDIFKTVLSFIIFRPSPPTSMY